jgi:hypothetical protein
VKMLDRFSRAVGLKTVLLVLLAGLPLALSGCAASDDEVTPQGTIALDKITIGSSENLLKEAMITFVRDPSALASAGGKSQYLSREKTSAGGQYIVQCKDGVIFEISELFTDRLIAKDAATVQLKALLPKGAPDQSRVEEKSDSEIYYFGSDYTGELIFKDAKKELATRLTTCNIQLDAKAEQAVNAEKAERKPLVDKARQAK